MPAPTQSARIDQIADLAGPVAKIHAAIARPSEAVAPWLGVLGHLRQLYRAELHSLLRSALDIHIDGHPLPDKRHPAHHMTCAAAELVRLSLAAPEAGMPISVLAQNLVTIWVKSPQSGPAVDTLAALLPQRHVAAP